MLLSSLGFCIIALAFLSGDVQIMRGTALTLFIVAAIQLLMFITDNKHK